MPKRSGRVSSASSGKGQEHFSTVLFQAILHDLKTPLTVIAGSLSTLLKEGDAALDEERDRVFERFRRFTHASDAGTPGRGLAVAKGIVEAHGGRIWAEGREGGGTIVTVSLPLSVRR